MENADPFVHVPPNGLHTRITRELNELRAISAMINSHLKNIDHARIIVPPYEINMDNLESEGELTNTPFISPFLDSDDGSDNGEVLNELDKYGNARNFYPNKIINSFDREDLAFLCMIGFRKFIAYFDPFLPMNIITRRAYNTILVEGLESTGRNLVAIVRDVYVFVESFHLRYELYGIRGHRKICYKRNEQDYNSTPKSMKKKRTVAGDGVRNTGDAIRSSKRRHQENQDGVKT
nr:hypothetical protein [Tanacetum cinerariifolium]